MGAVSFAGGFVLFIFFFANAVFDNVLGDVIDDLYLLGS